MTASAFPSSPVLGASGVAVVPSGEMVALDVQTALSTLYARSSLDVMFDRATSYTIIEEEFLIGGTPALGDRIGSYGWHLPSGTNALVAAPVVNLSHDAIALAPATVDNWVSVNLGSNMFRLAPAFRMEMWVRLATANDGSHISQHFLGMHDRIDNSASKPTIGFWWQVVQADAAAWKFAVGDAGTLDEFTTGFATDTSWHLLKAIYDGAGLLYLYQDGVAASGNPYTVTKFPTGTHRYGPALYTRKTTGTGTIRAANVDTFTLWRSRDRAATT